MCIIVLLSNYKIINGNYGIKNGQWCVIKIACDS